MPSAKITAAALERLAVGATLWDTEVRGLGAQRTPQNVRFLFKGRVKGQQVLIRMGRWGRGDLGIDDARKLATGYRLQTLRGEDPRGEKPEKLAPLTVNDLCDQYLDALPTLLISKARRPKRESTISTDRSRIDAHIRPLLGDKLVRDVTLADVETFQIKVAQGETAKARGEGRGQPARGGKGTASRTVGLLGAIFTYGVKKNLRSDNPVRGCVRYADEERKRRFTDDEYRRLAAGLAQVQAQHPIGVPCIKFLAVTGWRRGEAVNLRWSDIDLSRRTALIDTKTGKSMRALPHAALDVLAGLPRMHHSPWIFPAAHGEGPIGSLPRVWHRVVAAGGLADDLTPHTLRHTVASLGADLHLSESTIAGLLGHRIGTITGRYTHAADATLLAAADRVADAVLEQMGERKQASEKVIAMRA